VIRFSLFGLTFGLYLFQYNLPTPPAQRGYPLPAVYVLDSLHRAQLTDFPPRKPESAAVLYAPKGGHDSFQIVVFGGAAGLKILDAVIAPSPGGTVLPAKEFTLYREHFIAVSHPSKEGFGGARAGSFPDPLIPFRNPFTDERLTGGQYLPVPIDVAPGQNAVIYVELSIPRTAAAGTYASSVSIDSPAGTLATIPVTATVWDFAIPLTPSLHSAFNDYDSERLSGPSAYYGYDQNSPEHFSVAAAMDEQLLAHRLMPEIPFYSYFNVDDNGHIVNTAEQDEALYRLVSRPERSDFKLDLGEHEPFSDQLIHNRQKAITFLREARQWFEKRGLLDKVWFRPQDEPETDSDFLKTQAYADLIHEADPRFRVAITGDFEQSGYDRYLYGHLNTFVMNFKSFDPVKQAERQAAGDHFWTYTALIQNAENPSPFWMIEFPLLDLRITPWINYRYGVEGLLYWTTSYWNEIRARGASPWTDPCSVKERFTCFNSDGVFVYPGKEVNYIIPRGAYASASPSAVYGPVPSLRLKALRDGMEDYELLTLAAKKDAKSATHAAILVACRGDADLGDASRNCFHRWDTDPKDLMLARLALADLIQSTR
jgi:hypothetical protein